MQSFDQHKLEVEERIDLIALLKSMRGYRRMTQAELGELKVWLPKGLLGPAVACSKRAMYVIIRTSSITDTSRNSSAEADCALLVLSQAFPELSGITYRKGSNQWCVIEQLATLI